MNTNSQKRPDKSWSLRTLIDPNANNALLAYSPIVRQLLFNRGVRNASQAELFLNPSDHLIGPFDQMPDMVKATERIIKALDSGEKIAIYGDFDADGITATALLEEAFSGLDKEVFYYIPNRVSEGHGLNGQGLQSLANMGVTVIITVDCGVTGLQDGTDYPQGIDIIVTDHHRPEEQLPPVYAVVNPMRTDSTYPWPELAGVGVALKLVQSLYSALGKTWDSSLLELVALGTVADVAPIVGENRYLVKLGIDLMRRTERPGILRLCELAGIKVGDIDEESIGFYLAPRLNAAGRLSEADISLKLLTTSDPAEARNLARSLDELNSLRQTMTKQIVERAKEVWNLEDVPDDPIIFVGGPDFAVGVAGLAASRMAEEYHLPCVIYQEIEGEIKASCRSVLEFDITWALSKCEDLFTRYGGHHQAAGFVAPIGNLVRIKERLHGLASQILQGKKLKPTIDVDAEILPSNAVFQLDRILGMMSPFGVQNRAPIFLAKDMKILSKRIVGQDSSHVKFFLGEMQTSFNWDAIGFGLADKVNRIGDSIDIVYRLKRNYYKKSNGANNIYELEILDLM
jgi:single-stranded-DNA-specific exonuclease